MREVPVKNLMILCVGASLLATGACRKAPETSAQPPRSQANVPAMTDDAAALAAAKCAGWPKEVLADMGKLSIEQPETGPAPYFNFPEGKTITVSAEGTCGPAAPTAVISLTPMKHFGQHIMAVTGGYATGHVWLLIFKSEDDGNRTFWVMDGVPSINMPFYLNLPAGNSSQEEDPSSRT